MCTPVGHSLCGVLVWTLLVLPARNTLHYLWRWTRRQWEGLALAVFMANLCDLDYLPGIFTGDLNAWHYMYTHSVGWIILAGAGTCLVWKALQPATEDKYFTLVFVALLSHLLLDWLTVDLSPPQGILAWWPFSLERTISPVSIFPNASKDTLGDLWQWRNLRPVAVELTVFGSLLAAVLFTKTRRRVVSDAAA